MIKLSLLDVVFLSSTNESLHYSNSSFCVILLLLLQQEHRGYECCYQEIHTKSKPVPNILFSHGGPTFMYENDDFGNKGAWNTVKKIGTNIKKNWKPDYIIVVSAHWQSSGTNLIEINYPKPAKTH